MGSLGAAEDQDQWEAATAGVSRPSTAGTWPCAEAGGSLGTQEVTGQVLRAVTHVLLRGFCAPVCHKNPSGVAVWG